jgi:nucleoside-diphosphate-sugar epimerase
MTGWGGSGRRVGSSGSVIFGSNQREQYEGEDGSEMVWKGKRVLVTGGASFIGSHLSEELVSSGAHVRVVDNLSSGRLENIKDLINDEAIEFIEDDLLDSRVAAEAVAGMDVVFHLAAAHGGRGYVDRHHAACASNLALDGIVFLACKEAGVAQTVYASSGCVYPNHLQADPDEEVFLTEDLVSPPHDADNVYGWAKLMGEITLKAYADEFGMSCASCRYFTAFGPRGHENHAIIAMIARSLVDEDPFVIWGDGRQIRNWTYVTDVVRGTIRAAEKIRDGTAVNIGTMEATRVREAAEKVLHLTGKDHISIQPDPTKPTGPMNRVADGSLAKGLLGFEPRVTFEEGLRRTIDWYYSTKDPKEVKASLSRRLTER